MTNPPARFFWYELMTVDVPAAAAFYAKVVGWNAQPIGPAAGDFVILQTGERGVAGVTGMLDNLAASGAAPFWVGYILSDDVDASVVRVVAAGGAVHRAPEDIPGIGRFAMVNDPQGAIFMLMKPQGPDQPKVDPMTPGFVGWHELMAVDGQAAADFYIRMFGWQRTAAHDMGPMGVYQLFGGDDGDIGGMMTKPPHIPSPHWNYYFSVESVKAGAERLVAEGGLVTNGPMQVPGGNWILQARDPQGAMFCLTSTAP